MSRRNGHGAGIDQQGYRVDSSKKGVIYVWGGNEEVKHEITIPSEARSRTVCSEEWSEKKTVVVLLAKDSGEF